MHDVQLRVSFWTSARGMDVVAAEVGPEFKSVFGRDICKVLATEGYDFALGYEESELVSSCGGELTQLDAGYLRADAWGELLDLAAFWEEVFESGVCVSAMLDVVEWFQARVFLSVIPGWQVLWVL